MSGSRDDVFGVRRGFAVFAVIWAISLLSLVVLSLQTTAYTSAFAGREALGVVRAQWAAKAGLERAIATIAADTLDPNEGDAYAVFVDLEAESVGVVGASGSSRRRLAAGTATFELSFAGPEGPLPGVRDAHARMNINTLDTDSLLLLPFMTEDVADSILDWIDGDEDANLLGAEASAYQTGDFPYLPRNAPIRQVEELELIIGVDPIDVRGEDWNLNGVLDPEEDDGDATWPPDNRDGVLDAGWAEFVAGASGPGAAGGIGPGFGLSGEPRLDLAIATSDEIVQRLGVSTEQADIIADYGASGEGSLAELVTEDLSSLVQGPAGPGGGQQQPQVEDLDDEQIGLLLDECVVGDVPPGRVNINTCDEELFEYIASLDPAIADALIQERRSRSTGFVSMGELLAIPSVDRDLLAELSEVFTTRSEAFIVRSVGRDEVTGVEYEIVAVVDRSTLPVTIRDLRTP